ncbi:MAG: polyprenyl synthetase [Candidatus Moraniibacteriota bacterium]|nr:MAG: polyprenyl synthetase [Candidatus Moranbacteria bacterium]
MDFKKELSTLKSEIDHEIEIYLDGAIKEAEKTDAFVTAIFKYFKKTILSGGKRIRPIMMYWGYVGAGGNDRQEIIRASISIELIHAFLLMHDDIIDRDDLRRGKKTIHAKYRDFHKRFMIGDDSEHFGTSVGIISGDLIYSLGNQVLFSSQFEPRLIISALNKMQDIVGLTCVGEMQDIYMEYSDNVKEKDILKMYENKTARYTFDGPLKLGAMLAGAGDELCDELTRFAIPLGIAFQIHDDILGVFGNERKTGKPVGSDIAEGKKTVLVSRAYKKATEVQRRVLDELLGKKDISRSDVKRFQNVLVESGAKKEVELYVESLLTEARGVLAQLKLKNNAVDFLEELILYLSNRKN